jgi:uncharacterized protein YoxC
MGIDLSGNGSLADEAALITALVGMLVAIVATLRQSRINGRKVDEVGNTLNHMDDEPLEGVSPSLGQRVVRIERQVDGIHTDLRDFTKLMTEHIQWEAQKYERLDAKVTDIGERVTTVETSITPIKRVTKAPVKRVQPGPKRSGE